MPLQNDSRQLKSNKEEFQKTHTEYDGSGRATHYYEAISTAADGEACMLTTFLYDGVSNRIATTREWQATWSAAWEVGLPTP